VENVIIVKVVGNEKMEDVRSDIEEMKGLVDTAGGTVVDVLTVKRKEISPAYFIGKGKAEEIAEKYKDTADVIVFDSILKPVQVRNLEKTTQKRVVDRPQLILDIFASRAHTNEGKLQVEFAQLNYLLPRLTGHGVEMSRLGGGIGTRGPGETKLEVDTRKIRWRIEHIKTELEKIKNNRTMQRNRRKSVPIPLVALVGYTNVGKTMFLNSMTNAGKLSEDKLFATLDPKIKKFRLPAGYNVLFSDTVGFIKNLPTGLIAAFRATLEEVKEADIILLIMDISDPNTEKHREVVLDILKDMGAYENKKIIEVYNKVDLIDEETKKFVISRLGGIYISAKTGEGMDTLVKALEQAVAENFKEHRILVMHGHLAHAAVFYDEGIVLSRSDTEEGIKLHVKCMDKTMEKYSKLEAEEK
jgi:GTP-binding protein HflX